MDETIFISHIVHEQTFFFHPLTSRASESETISNLFSQSKWLIFIIYFFFVVEIVD